MDIGKERERQSEKMEGGRSEIRGKMEGEREDEIWIRGTREGFKVRVRKKGSEDNREKTRYG